jgi:catechol 2,3-dioxygenase-like lactoylglutathione lyase family enzyme
MDGSQPDIAMRNVAGIVSPTKLAHFVLRTSRYRQLVEWYKVVLGAHSVFENEFLAFLSYDEEHHRVAIIEIKELGLQLDGVAGVHHIAFTYKTLYELLENYDKLKTLGILPVYTINHGPTTSLYYEDPDRNQLEFQVENYESVEESSKFFFSEAFAENPVGVEFDPDQLLERLRAGVPEHELKLRPNDGARDASDIKLR